MLHCTNFHHWIVQLVLEHVYHDQLVLLEMCLVCLVSLKFLAMHMADFLSNTIKGPSFGTMSGSSFNNS